MENIMNTIVIMLKKVLKTKRTFRLIFRKDMKLVRQKVFLDEILGILTKKPTGESVLLRGDTLVS